MESSERISKLEHENALLQASQPALSLSSPLPPPPPPPLEFAASFSATYQDSLGLKSLFLAYVKDCMSKYYSHPQVAVSNAVIEAKICSDGVEGGAGGGTVGGEGEGEGEGKSRGQRRR